MPETEFSPDAAERLRPLLIRDVAERLREARRKSGRSYEKAMEDQMDRLYRTARQLSHPDPFTYADSIIGEAMNRSGLHPQQVVDIVHRVIVKEKLKARDHANITYAKEALACGESQAEIIAYMVQRDFPDDPANGHDYARYILADTRLVVEKERTASLNHQPSLEQSTMNDKNNNNRNFNSDQYKRDWAYAARALQKGEAPDKVTKDMAALRKDQSDPQQYAEKTVAKVQASLEVKKELGADIPPVELTKETTDALEKSLKQLSKLEVARRLYNDGGDRETVTKSLQQDQRLGKKEATTIASEAEMRFLAERDLNYAIRARERGESDDRIIPKIAEYRQGKIDDPQAYARSLVDAADQVRDAEREVSITPLLQQRMEAIQQQYRPDLQQCVLQLENRSPAHVTLAINERRPDRAYDSPSFRLHGQPDPSYAVPVVQQAERIREITNQGRKL